MVLQFHHSLILFLVAVQQHPYNEARKINGLDVTVALTSSDVVSSLSSATTTVQQHQHHAQQVAAGLLLLLRPILFPEQDNNNNSKDCAPCANPFDNDDDDDDDKDDPFLEAAEAAFSSLGMLWSAGIFPDNGVVDQIMAQGGAGG
mmetsp:Transcript_9135/g.25277  ORF Transcript_9135/g.25277 Transcript_9135/m.25277 type:complete len:146 (+) Transcript_9135:64-501(+)|eukprot:CAMPEP_0168731378 /NCGR_PEP_ID=MMETSP0724-20121128/7222_1 /TAXON_ID=265536 /ORGANISM="Amphiprora sp., Strain CCMP467" /LENGTH=145 /DNA_ID=CAMNT_0008778359 /DNA_START=1 /DNA_END=438 /DNA_ORIENTATION=-